MPGVFGLAAQACEEDGHKFDGVGERVGAGARAPVVEKAHPWAPESCADMGQGTDREMVALAGGPLRTVCPKEATRMTVSNAFTTDNEQSMQEWIINQDSGNSYGRGLS